MTYSIQNPLDIIAGGTKVEEGFEKLTAEDLYIIGGLNTLDTEKAPKANPIFTGTVVLPFTTSIGDVSNTELGYVNGVTSAIQPQLDAKETPTGAQTKADVVQTNLTNHINDTIDAHVASAITYTPTGDLTAEETQGAIDELEANKANKSETYSKTEMFDIVLSKNLYDPSLAVDGKLANFVDGTYATSANFAMLGKQPVQAGKSYAISWPSTYTISNRAYCYNSSGVFIGMSHAISSYTVAPGITDSGEGTQTLNGRKQFIVNLAYNSPVAFIDLQIMSAAHVTADFDTLRNLMQIEEGVNFSSFSAYGDNKYYLKSSLIPVNDGLTVIKSGNDVYLRTPWDANNDYIERLKLHDNASANDPINFVTCGLISKTVADSSVAVTSPTLLKDSSDDITPVSYNNTYIGANHGAFVAVTLTATAHDKTAQDVGSEWLDNNSVKWYIMQIIDTNTLLVLSANSSVTDVWAFTLTVPGTTLTHSASATHTSSITFSGQVQSQLTPAIKNQSKQLLLNGIYPITTDGIYSCDHLNIIHSYDITDVPALLAYVISKVGSSVQPSFAMASIAIGARVSVTYRFSDNASCTIFQSFRTSKQVNFASSGYLGFIQAAPVFIPASGTLYEYIPKMAPFTGAVSYDFANIQNITSLSESIEGTTARWADTSKPPDRWIQFAKDSGGNKFNNFGFAIGYCSDFGAAISATRAAALSSAFLLYTSKKQYPKLANGSSTTYPYPGSVAANTVFDAISFRCPVNYNYDSQATNISWYYVSNAIYLLLDYHQNIDKVLALPQKFIGKTVTVVEKSTDFTLKSSFVTPDGIAIKVVNNYGYAVLKLV